MSCGDFQILLATFPHVSPGGQSLHGIVVHPLRAVVPKTVEIDIGIIGLVVRTDNRVIGQALQGFIDVVKQQSRRLRVRPLFCLLEGEIRHVRHRVFVGVLAIPVR